MNMRMVNPSANIPARGWSARQPETGAALRGSTLTNVMQAVHQYREANKLPIEANFRRQVEIQICATLSQEEAGRTCTFLDEDDGRNPPELREWTKRPSDLLKFAQAVKGVLKATLKGITLHVPQEEANRRAAICAACRFNVPIADCWGCGTLGAAYREIAIHKDTPSNTQLKSCGVCGCQNATQVWLTGAVLYPVSKEQGVMADQFPGWCWKKDLLREPEQSET